MSSPIRYGRYRDDPVLKYAPPRVRIEPCRRPRSRRCQMGNGLARTQNGRLRRKSLKAI